jgi:hypothetical protein
VSILNHDDILRIYRAAVATRLAGSRLALLTGLQPTLIAGLVSTPVATEQLLMDLDTLNGIERLDDGSMPLDIWLKNAALLSEGRREAAIFHDASAAIERASVLDAGLERSLRRPAPVTTPQRSVMSNLELIDASLDTSMSEYTEEPAPEDPAVRWVHRRSRGEGGSAATARGEAMSPVDEPGHKEHLPILDFKFQNTGYGTALLWKFGVQVLGIEIDTTPDPQLRVEVRGRELDVHAIDDGWGPSRSFVITIDDPVLKRLYPKEALRCEAEIEGGGWWRKILTISPEMNQEALREVRAERDEEEQRRYGPFTAPDPSKRVIDLAPNFSWACADGGRPELRGTGTVHLPLGLYLTHEGFALGLEKHYMRALDSDAFYCAILDVASAPAPLEQTYSLSRQIPPGDVERFHVLVGATRSCTLRARFRFWVDKETIVASPEFRIEIHNPRQRAYHKGYDQLFVDANRST